MSPAVHSDLWKDRSPRKVDFSASSKCSRIRALYACLCLYINFSPGVVSFCRYVFSATSLINNCSKSRIPWKFQLKNIKFQSFFQNYFQVYKCFGPKFPSDWRHRDASYWHKISVSIWKYECLSLISNLFSKYRLTMSSSHVCVHNYVISLNLKLSENIGMAENY